MAASPGNGVLVGDAADSLAVVRRKRARPEEWTTQTRVAELLKRHLPAGCFSTALENAPRSRLAGLLTKLRGTRPGLPDIWVIWLGENVVVELKSRSGIASKVQRQVRDELLAAGVTFWWLARSPRACLLALHLSGVPLVGWRPPKGPLPEWKGLFADPHVRLPMHPVVARERAAAQQRYRERRREGEAARRIESDFPTSAPGDVAVMPRTSAAATFAVDGGDHFISRGQTAMTYDRWKATNPQDEQLGPEPLPYDAVDDFEQSIDVAYAAVRERIANGGPPWIPKPFGS
jgi:hypothetical protein